MHQVVLELTGSRKVHVISEHVDFDRVKSIADIGSWLGKQAMEFNNIFPDAEVYAFEPDPSTFPYTDIVLSATRVELFEIALSNIDSKTTFFHTRGHFGGTSSLLKPEDVPFSNDKTYEEHDVDVARLDTLIESGVIKIPQIMKIDVQGNESAVLAGMGKYLDEVLAKIGRAHV